MSPLAAALLLPLLLAVAAAWPRQRRAVLLLTPLAPWPALAAALWLPDGVWEWPALVLGLSLGLDTLARVFLLFSGLIWSVAAFHVLAGRPLEQPGGARFLICFLAAMAGNLGLICAQDGISYYVFFSLMSLSAYGLINTTGEPAARSAARLYLVLALAGEMAMLMGFMLLASGVAGLGAAVLLYLGMGVKHAVLPLHVWLPLAHGNAPAPASALLSGAMLKAGLVGWLRFLPATGAEALIALAGPMLWLGLAAAFYGALCGSMQRKPKMLLGYSSVSQLGIITAACASAAAAPDRWVATLPMVMLLVFHHALVKAALFLGMGVRGGRLVWIVLALLSLSLIGLPYSGGYLGKLWLEQHLGQLPADWYGPAKLLLSLTTSASTVLMARFLWLAWRGAAPMAGPGGGLVTPLPFLVLGALALPAPWLLFYWLHPQPPSLLNAAPGWSSLWPLLLGLAPVLLALARARRGGRLRWHVPPGDVVAPLLAWLAGRSLRPDREDGGLPHWRPPRRWLNAAEAELRRFATLGTAFWMVLLLWLGLGLLGWAGAT